jgi:hypothetical protein
MTEHLLDSKQSHVLRWLILIPLSLGLGTLVVTMLLGIAPDRWSGRIPENAKFLLVVGVAAAGCVVLEWRLRQRQQK